MSDNDIKITISSPLFEKDINTDLKTLKQVSMDLEKGRIVFVSKCCEANTAWKAGASHCKYCGKECEVIAIRKEKP